MKGLAFLVIVLTVCAALWYVGLWIYRRPTVRRQRLNESRQIANQGLDRAEEAEAALKDIKALCEKHSVVDPILSDLIRAVIEQHQMKLDKLPKPERQRN